MLGAPLQPQRLHAFVLARLLEVVAAEPQALVAVLAFPDLGRTARQPLLRLGLVGAVVLVLAVVLFFTLQPAALRVTYHFDDGALVDALFLVVGGEAAAFERDADAFFAAVGVGGGAF